MFDRFKSYPVNRQVLLATCIGVTIFVLLVTAWLSLRTGYSPLFKDLRAPDAAAIIAELDKKKEPYRLADQGQTVLVPTDRVDATRLELMNGDLALKGTVGFELFNKSDMGLTDFAQKINFQRALQGELERTILTLDGVESTRVHLSLGENRIFREDRIPPKASVTIHMRQNAHLPAAAAAGVQRLIAAAVPQLEPTDVVILDEAGQIIATSLTPFGSSGPASNPVQDFYSARIRDALLPIYAEGDFQIAVKARSTSANAGRSVRLPSDAQSPQPRDYALDVTVAPSQSISNETKEDVKNLVAGAINFDPKRGDRIGFGPIAMSNDNLSASAPAVLPQAFPPQPSTPSSEAPATTIFPLGIWVVVMIAALTCLFVLAVRLFRGKPRMLSTADRERLIDTLNALVETEGGKMPSATERAIRREVTRLAQLDDDSLAAVLDGLNPATRARVSGLLMEYRPAKPEQGSSDKSNMVSALSPWLESRMLGDGTAVTAAVRGVLVDCARRQAGVTATQISKSESRSLFQQLLRPRDKGRRS